MVEVPPTKTCPKCKQEKSATFEHFNRSGRRLESGRHLSTRCRVCLEEMAARRFVVQTCPKCEREKPATLRFFNEGAKGRRLTLKCQDCIAVARRFPAGAVKICQKCEQQKPLTREEFGRYDSGSRQWRRYQICLECRSSLPLVPNPTKTCVKCGQEKANTDEEFGFYDRRWRCYRPRLTCRACREAAPRHPSIDPTITPCDADKAYAAGFFDGEGSVASYYGRDRHGREHFTFLVQATQGCLDPLTWLRDRWGGMVRPRKTKNRPAEWNPIYEWMAFGPKRNKFLADVLPYLIVKREQAALGLRLGAIDGRNGSHELREGKRKEKRILIDELHRLNGKYDNRPKGRVLRGVA